MRGLAEAIVLALLWVAVTRSATAGNFAIGVSLAYVVLALARRVPPIAVTLRRVVLGIALVLYFVWELVLSNLRIAYDILSPRFRFTPGVVGVRLDARTDLEITVLANLITLTPGTLSLDVSPDRRVLYIHTMHVGDRDAFERSIKDGFERRVLEVLR
jgi:multicomponent Na+:H+ antiporter subunit E